MMGNCAHLVFASLWCGYNFQISIKLQSNMIETSHCAVPELLYIVISIIIWLQIWQNNPNGPYLLSLYMFLV